ncbi:MAG: hypothetical protein PWQ59_548, partial [Thermoanaerobacterium sp.]|nr:hypothetical protein [Thermoanaerobacterium sp.]MDI3477023.1 hypothetical protein [Thermoanaerobacterium sp.]MDK2805078.1 hypothetical protein [Thermoanaerobacterium sp.]MDK2805390.1 hypothetical protein [Thermoanaerobacterium sp.]MDN5317542.1 hypothetical protein [Thermoanaerobacterium sp.]
MSFIKKRQRNIAEELEKKLDADNIPKH